MAKADIEVNSLWRNKFQAGTSSLVPGWAWGIRPMNVVKQTFDYIMDREFEALIAEINHQTHCENLTRGFTVIALESLLSHEIGQAV